MPRYLITMNAKDAATLEAMLGGRVEVVPSYGHLSTVHGERAVISGLDAITDEEYEQSIAPRLRASGPLYHAGGPGRRDRDQPVFGPVLGRDTQATCLKHRRKVTWLPGPDWWIHSDNRTCMAMYDLPAPPVFLNHDGSVRKSPYEQQYLDRINQRAARS